MVDLIFQQLLMEVVIHFEKEIAVTAIEDNSQFTVLDTVNLHDCRMIVPNLLIVALVSELLISQLLGNGRISTPPLVLPAAPNTSL